MRRAQLNDGIASVKPSLDDLGWNDMGEDRVRPERPIDQPAPTQLPKAPVSPLSAPQPVAQQIAAIARRIAARPSIELAFEPENAPEPRVRPARGRKAAFTLRLDSERHLRLRLLSAITHKSAQQLLVEVLDSMLAEHDELEDIARRTKTARS